MQEEGSHQKQPPVAHLRLQRPELWEVNSCYVTICGSLWWPSWWTNKNEYRKPHITLLQVPRWADSKFSSLQVTSKSQTSEQRATSGNICSVEVYCPFSTPDGERAFVIHMREKTKRLRTCSSQVQLQHDKSDQVTTLFASRKHGPSFTWECSGHRPN